MGKEAFNYSYRRQESEAFPVEHLHKSSDEALREDIVSYLGEYRLKVSSHPYELAFSDGKICNPFTKEPMADLAKRAIDKRLGEGKPVVREKAELSGFESLDSQLLSAKDGDMVIWASPPGPKEEGYGDYGFLFKGKIKKTDGSNGSVRMTAYRIEEPSIEQFDQAFAVLTGDNSKHLTAPDFLKDPRIIRDNNQNVGEVLEKSFSFKDDDNKKRINKKIIHELNPLISHFITVLKIGTRQEKIKTLNALENLTLKLKGKYEEVQEEKVFYHAEHQLKNGRIEDLVRAYSYEPPKVGGSCGSSSETNSNNPLNKYNSLNNLLNSGEWFNCPKCGYKADGPVGDTCPECGLTKEEYAEQGNEVC